MVNKSEPHEGRDEVGRFMPGNRFWMARSSHGAKPKFERAEDLWDACLEYFDWAHENPLFEDKLVTFQGDAKHEPVAKMRAMTIAGLCLFLDIEEGTWREWRKSRADLSSVITRAEAVIYQQKFSGAAADLLNPSIIARDLGLADRHEMTGRDGGPIETKDESAHDKLLAALNAIAERTRET
ncbi:DNA-packaging protein [Roseinatronobacter alkalisoli]|uniref:DNA-packaging protein n=1 Tax=Roseinatronobacter alkalisoli TaxID=3028235 RepID=A0ABT5TEA7_9RHOB|nr:DNA-packaging protein [Roseinatronobacter sp. HJB301]MDD7973434.1 DNA-packaging protein [Roseinatronobacter sp. HJB301]